MKFITHAELTNWLDEIAMGSTLIAPRRTSGITRYQRVSDSSQIDWAFTRPELPVKEVFFPSTDRLLLIEKSGDQVNLFETLPESEQSEQVVFGVRSCDVLGVLAMDALFIESDPRDPYYTRRREMTTMIGMVCSEMDSSCFCTSMGGAPDDSFGMDLMLREVDGGYALQVITEKGERLLQGLQLSEFKGELPSPRLNEHLPIPEKSVWITHFNDSFWMNMSERCLSCRACAYVCPTCRCFDVRDEVLPSGNGHVLYERIRCWDSCASPVYRRVAGGHNPRDLKGERLRNRFYCKFHYYPEQYGPSACTGCGRCIDVCPVNIDISEVLGYLAEVST
jgi:sulfhydrogenase subunit beta (sulfur reductase)